MLNYLQQKVRERGWVRKPHTLQLKAYVVFRSPCTRPTPHPTPPPPHHPPLPQAGRSSLIWPLAIAHLNFHVYGY